MGYTFDMIILLHVIIALSSMVYTGLVAFYPSKSGLKISYSLILMTFISGSYLVFIKPAHMVQSCMMGLAYLGAVSVGIAFAQRKLAKESKKPSELL